MHHRGLNDFLLFLVVDGIIHRSKVFDFVQKSTKWCTLELLLCELLQRQEEFQRIMNDNTNIFPSIKLSCLKSVSDITIAYKSEHLSIRVKPGRLLLRSCSGKL
jgi:hypothetical protein